MSALKLKPQEKYAPKWLKKYYHGYDPELYKEIVELYRKCPYINIKRHTALEYAKMAQEEDLENKKEIERSKYRGYTFINFEDGWGNYFKSKEIFCNEFQKHIKALLLHLGHTFNYAINDVKIFVNGYNPYTNRMDQNLDRWNLATLLKELERGTIYSYETLAESVWRHLMDKDDKNIQKRAISGWKIYGNSGEKPFFTIEFLYDPALPDLIKEEEARRAEEYRKNHPTPDEMGYHGGPGHYTGD